MIILRQKEFTRAEKEAMFQLMRLTKGFKSLPKELNSVENATRFKKFSNRLVKFANDPEAHKLSAEELKEMKGFLSDIGATKFADNFEPIINKYYGNNNIEAWKRLKLREEKLPAKALVNRYDRLEKRFQHEWDINDEVESYDSFLKSVKGKNNKEIFSSPEGKLVKNIIKEETGGVGQPSFYFNKVKDREKLSDKLTNDDVKSVSDLSLSYKRHYKNLSKKLNKENLQGNRNFLDPKGSDYGNVFLSHADLSTLSHELGHGKSLANSIAAGTTFRARVDKFPIPKKKSELPTGSSVRDKATQMYDRLDNLSIIAEENMANVYGRDIIRKYGGKNVNKYLADYEKMVDNVNMKSHLSSARRHDTVSSQFIVSDIMDRHGIV